MTEFNEANAPAPSAPMMTIGLVAVGAVLLVAAGVFVATSRWSSGSGGQAQASTVAPSGELETLRIIQDRVRRDAEERDRLDRTLSMNRADSMLEVVAGTRATIQQAQAASAEWEGALPALLTSEEGKRIAADPVQLTIFDGIYRHPLRPQETELSAIEKRLAGLEAELRRVKESQDALLSEASAAKLQQQIETERLAAERARDAVTRDLSSVQAIVTKTASGSIASVTLQEALDELERVRAEERAKLIAEAVALVNVEQDELDKNMIASRKREIREADRQIHDAALADTALRKRTEADVAQRKSKEDDIKTRAESATVQENYRPFLGLGLKIPWNNAPENSQYCNWIADPNNKLEKRPVEYNQLRRHKALDRFDTFVAFATNPDNDRGAWPPVGSDSTATLEEYRQRFNEFKELADLWVKMGLLRQ